jgi:hypothetical protein
MRSKIVGVSLCLCALSLSVSPQAARAQAAPELPQPSLKARVEQRVGLTDFSVDYSSPAVKGRPIWGSLVSYDKPWRTGANAATKLTASREFTFGGKTVAAGSYALYTIPGKSTWTVALNSSLEAWGNDGFDTKKDVVRVTVTPTAISAPRERLTFTFDDASDQGVKLTLEWEKLRVSVPITVDTKGQALKNIQTSVDDTWRPHFASARYLLESGGDLELALRYVDQSIAIKPTWWNNWVRAQILQKKGRAQDAVASGEKTLQLGNGDRTFEGFFKADIAKAVAEWKKPKP